MSIRPEYANLIFSRQKRFELRRQRPQFSSGDIVVVYVTRPEQLVRGAFRVARVASMAVRSVWREFCDDLGVSRAVFDRYFDGCSLAHAIEIDRVWTWDPFSLASLRRRFHGFNPPQSYMHWPERWTLPDQWQLAR